MDLCISTCIYVWNSYYNVHPQTLVLLYVTMLANDSGSFTTRAPTKAQIRALKRPS